MAGTITNAGALGQRASCRAAPQRHLPALAVNAIMRMILNYCTSDRHDPAAPADLSALYSAHHGWLQGWLRHKLGSGADAADVAQDTFMRLLQRRDRPQAALRTPRAYLTRIAQGLVIDHYRRRDVEQAYLQALAFHPEHTAPSPEARLLIIETLLRLDTALDAPQAARTPGIFAGPARRTDRTGHRRPARCLAGHRRARPGQRLARLLPRVLFLMPAVLAPGARRCSRASHRLGRAAADARPAARHLASAAAMARRRWPP